MPDNSRILVVESTRPKMAPLKLGRFEVREAPILGLPFLQARTVRAPGGGPGVLFEIKSAGVQFMLERGGSITFKLE